MARHRQAPLPGSGFAVLILNMRTSRWTIRNRAEDCECEAVPFALCKGVCWGGGNSHFSQSEGVEVSFCEKPTPNPAYLYFLSLYFTCIHVNCVHACVCMCVYMSMDAQICQHMCINVYDERWPWVFFISPPTPLYFLRPSLSFQLV